MTLKLITRDMFLFAATLRERLSNDRALALDALTREATAHFEAMDREAEHHPTLAVRYQQIRFALVALIDELVVSSTWSHAPNWQFLEEKYYGTTIAGDRIYDLVDAFTAADSDLLEGFFYILALGFRGKYALDEDQWAVALADLYRRLPSTPGEDLKLAPEAYRVIPRKAQRLDPLFSLWRSLIIFVGVLLVLFVFYKVAWHDVVKRAQVRSAEVAGKVADDELRRKLHEVSQ